MTRTIGTYYFFTSATAGTNVLIKRLAGPIKLVGMYVKNETTPSYCELYIRESDQTANKYRHYLASKWQGDIYEPVFWDGQLWVNSPYYLVWVVKGAVASDQIHSGYSWEIAP